MPPRSRAPRSRVSTLRRPRVAGLTPSANRSEGPDLIGRGADTRSRTDHGPTGHGPTSHGPTAVEPIRGGRLSPRSGRSPGPVPLLALALVLLTGLAATFGFLDASLRNTPSAANTALVDVGATAEAAGQLSDALETVYSYDFARLDQNERAARDVITPAFAAEFDKLFAQVRELAPQQQAVVTATVTVSAVQRVEGDRAVLVAFMDQQATRAAAGGQATQLAAAGRLTVTGERVDGRWKIAAVESR